MANRNQRRTIYLVLRSRKPLHRRCLVAKRVAGWDAIDRDALTLLEILASRTVATIRTATKGLTSDAFLLELSVNVANLISRLKNANNGFDRKETDMINQLIKKLTDLVLVIEKEHGTLKH